MCVRRSIAPAASYPDDVEEIRVVKAEQDANPVISIAVLSSRYREEELTRIIETDIIPEITAIDGVADVPVFGNRQREMHVVVDPPRLARFGLSVADVANVLRDARF